MKRWCLSFVIKAIFFVAVAGVALGALTMYLWNWLIPALFHGPEITFIQALGVLLLSKVLFGFGFKGRRCCHGHCGPGMHEGFRGRWRKRWEEKFAHLSPEEKEKYKEKFKCWGFGEEEEKK